MQYYPQTYYYRGEDNRGLLLPLLVGAAVGFPFGYIASNTNKKQLQLYANAISCTAISYVSTTCSILSTISLYALLEYVMYSFFILLHALYLI